MGSELRCLWFGIQALLHVVTAQQVLDTEDICEGGIFVSFRTHQVLLDEEYCDGKTCSPAQGPI